MRPAVLKNRLREIKRALEIGLLRLQWRLLLQVMLQCLLLLVRKGLVLMRLLVMLRRMLLMRL